jgi:hypothetical protein
MRQKENAEKGIFARSRRNPLISPDSRKEMEGKGNQWKGFFAAIASQLRATVHS